MTRVDLWVGLGAAVAGSGVSAIGAWGGNLVVERRRENLQVLGAMEMLELEMKENADRLRKGADPAALPLGVWASCKPTLAPPSLKKAGALQPPVTRRLMMPLPPRPPMTKPALIMPGKTATASALSSRPFGMERSGVPMICSKTRAASADFFEASFNCLGLAEGAGFVAVLSSQKTRMEALTIFREHVPTRDALVVQAANWLGAIQVARKAYVEAEALLLPDSNRLFTPAAIMSPKERRVAVGHIVKLYEAWGKPGQAADWQKKLDQLAQSQPSHGP